MTVHYLIGLRSTTTATGPGHSHAQCDAWPVGSRCDESGDCAEWRPRRSRDPRAHNPAAAAVAPGSRCSGGIASTNARASCESFRLAPVRRTASGMPSPSQIRWRLLPRLARSVGFGLRSGHRRRPRGWNNCPRLPATNQSGWSERANPRVQSGSDRTRPPVAGRASDASTSSPTRTRVPAGASARGCRFGGQIECR